MTFCSFPIKFFLGGPAELRIELTPSLSCCAVYSSRWEAVVLVAVRMSNCGDHRVQLYGLILWSQLAFLLHYFKYPYSTRTLYQVESTHYKTQQYVIHIL